MKEYHQAAQYWYELVKRLSTAGRASSMTGPDSPSRRDFLRTSAAIGLAPLLTPTSPPDPGLPLPDSLLFRAPPIETVRIGFVGLGGQGSVHVENLLSLEGVEIKALCDIVPGKVSAWQQKVRDLGRPEPAGYDRGPRDFERLCAEQELDLVFNATPWEWHVPYFAWPRCETASTPPAKCRSPTRWTIAGPWSRPRRSTGSTAS